MKKEQFSPEQQKILDDYRKSHPYNYTPEFRKKIEENKKNCTPEELAERRNNEKLYLIRNIGTLNKNLLIPASQESPYIFFDYENGIFEIEGRSIMQNVNDFNKPVLDWLKLYYRYPQINSRIELTLSYFNKQSSQIILGILKLFDLLHKKLEGVSLEWYYYKDEETFQPPKDIKTLYSYPIYLRKGNKMPLEIIITDPKTDTYAYVQVSLTLDEYDYFMKLREAGMAQIEAYNLAKKR